MVAIARKLSISGSLSVLRIPRNGFYERGLPAGIPLRFRLRSAWLELSLRARLFLKGAWRGLQGTGVIAVGRLYLSVLRADGRVEHLGLVSTKVVTNAGVTFLRDDWNNNAQDLTTLNFHGIGTGAAAENVTDTALGTESTTALNPASTRATGTRSTPSSNVYRTVGTLTAGSAIAATEHGIFSQAATGGGTLWDRSLFSVVNLGIGDSLQATYDATLSAGG